MLAQIQAKAATTWRSPQNRKPTMRGVERLRACCEGFSLHAAVVIADHDREALERLCRYGTRPAFAQERPAWTTDGQIAYRLKRPWPDGRTELVLPEHPTELALPTTPARGTSPHPGGSDRNPACMSWPLNPSDKPNPRSAPAAR